MIFLGHIGISLVAGQLYNEVRRERVNLKPLALFAMMPDIIDKPLALLFPIAFGYHTRLGGHSLAAFGLASLVFAGLALKGRLKPAHAALYSAAWLGHLLCDRLWQHDLEYFLWPALGTPPARDPTFIRRFADGGLHPETWIMEGVGLVFLVAAAVWQRRVKSRSA